MELVAIVIVLVVLEYVVFMMLVGGARGKYDVPAPATSGNEMFERYYRVQLNTAEQLLVFFPAILIYGYFGNPTYAAIGGVIFLVGRAVYAYGYIKEPKSRAAGMLIGFITSIAMLIAGVVAIISGLS